MVLRDWMSDEIFDQKAKSCSDGGLPSLWRLERDTSTDQAPTMQQQEVVVGQESAS